MIHRDFDHLYSGILRMLRHTLNQCPEPSGAESVTAEHITTFLESYHPDELLTELGGHGVAAVYEGSEPGPTVLIRSELDAIATEETDADGGGREPEDESGSFAFEAPPVQVAHRCGHDAHMTMVAGLAPLFHIHRPGRGRIVLLFQPAEETGEGARAVIDDPRFDEIRPDYALAIHNIPGEPAHSVVCRAETFACASVGMRVRLDGFSSHAAEPERARSPGKVFCELLAKLPALQREGDTYRLVTITHIRMGRATFGVTPGHGELFATLRAVRDEVLEDLRTEAEEIVRSAAERGELDVEIEWVEQFPATLNDPGLVEVLEGVCQRQQIDYREADVSFRWSEDFGQFGSVCPSLLFGLGIGEDRPALHHPEYEFPDEVITTGVMLWSALAHVLEERDPPGASSGAEGHEGTHEPEPDGRSD